MDGLKIAPRVGQVSHCHPPRLSDRLFSAGQADVSQVRGPLVSAIVADKELAAPDRSVAPEAGAVESDADDRLLQAVLGHATGQVGVMMLHRNQPDSLVTGPTNRVSRRGVVGMKIVGDSSRLDVECLLVQADVSLEGAECLVMVEVAHVVAEDRMVTAAQPEHPLQLTSDRENGDRAVRGQSDRLRCVATGTADRHLLACGDSSHRVVAADVDWPVVYQQHVRDRPQPLDRILDLIGDRLVRPVSAGHHQGHVAQVMQEQMVQRRVGEHNAEVWVAGGYRFGDLCAGPPAQEHDRTPWRLEQAKLVPTRKAQRSHCRQVADHDCQRFLIPVFSPP